MLNFTVAASGCDKTYTITIDEDARARLLAVLNRVDDVDGLDDIYWELREANDDFKDIAVEWDGNYLVLPEVE